MPINFISNVNSLRYAQCYRLQELLRVDHNKKGLDYTTGKIDKQQWENYLNTYFNPKQHTIVVELLKLRELIKRDHSINTTLDDVII